MPTVVTVVAESPQRPTETRPWPLRARSRSRSCPTSHSRAASRTLKSQSNAIDNLVELAHAEPEAAEVLLVGSPELATRASSWGENCLQAASHLGHWRLTLRLLELGTQSDLFAECSLGDPVRAAAALGAYRAELLGVHGLPVLHFAIMSRDPAAVEMLLEAGAPMNSPNAALPALHSAIAAGEYAIVQQLLQAGADPLAVDALGCTALDWAGFLYGVASPLVSVLARPSAGRSRYKKGT